MTTSFVIMVLAAYLLGSIPFSQLIAHWRGGVRLREVGEGNVGSRNVWHIVGPAWGVLAAGLDVAKGLLAFQLTVFMHMSILGTMLVGIAVLLGHQFPIFLHGQGGKGLATVAGFLLALTSLTTLLAVAVFGLAYLILHDFNPSLIVGVVAILLLPLLFHQPLWMVALTVMLGLLLGFKKWLDYAHEARVWASHPWQGDATPGFHPTHPDDEVTPVPNANTRSH